MKVFLVSYHDLESVPLSTFLLSSNTSSVRRYVERKLGIFDSASDVTSSFSFDYGKIRECLSFSFPDDEVEVLMNILVRSRLFKI